MFLCNFLSGLIFPVEILFVPLFNISILGGGVNLTLEKAVEFSAGLAVYGFTARCSFVTHSLY